MTDFTDFKDKILICHDCGKEFTFTASEQKFYYRKGLTITKRCPQCRLIKKLDYSPEAKGGK